MLAIFNRAKLLTSKVRYGVPHPCFMGYPEAVGLFNPVEPSLRRIHCGGEGAAALKKQRRIQGRALVCESVRVRVFVHRRRGGHGVLAVALQTWTCRGWLQGATGCGWMGGWGA